MSRPVSGYRHLGPTALAELLASSISADPTVAASASVLDVLLARATRSIPNLLFWARLTPDPGFLSAPMQRLVDFSGGLPPLSDAELELLAWQEHVDFWQPEWPRAVRENLVRNATRWHRLKGTPAGVKMALSLFGVRAQVDESGRGANWAVYELELEEAPRGLLPTIVAVAEETAPQRCCLRRVYGGFDRRPIILDAGPALDTGYLDDDSGVWDPETGVKQSFGERFGLFADYSSTLRVLLGAEYLHAGRAFYVDRAILDHWKLDNPTVKSHGIVGGALISLMSMSLWGEKYRWEGPWNHRRWTGSAHPVSYPMPRRRIDAHYSHSKSQMVLDFARLDDALVTLDRPRAVVIKNPHRLDFHRLDRGQADLHMRVLDIHERFIHPTVMTAMRGHDSMGIGNFYVRAVGAQRGETRSGVGVTTYKEEVRGLLSLRRPYCLPDGTEWTGPWSRRAWRTMGVPAKSSTEGE